MDVDIVPGGIDITTSKNDQCVVAVYIHKRMCKPDFLSRNYCRAHT